MRGAGVVSVLIAAIVAVAGVSPVLGQDECAPPQPGERHAHPGQCCKLGDVKDQLMPETMKQAMAKCKEKFPRPERPTGPPPTGPPPTPSPEMRANMSCMAQCVMTEAGLVKNGVLDEAAVKSAFVSNDSAISSAVEAAKTQCLATYKQGVEQTPGECKSGADQLMKCMMRSIFLNCPEKFWTKSEECNSLKMKVEKCPMMPVMMMGGRGRKGSPRQSQS